MERTIFSNGVKIIGTDLAEFLVWLSEDVSTQLGTNQICSQYFFAGPVMPADTVSAAAPRRCKF